jgi:hypothetical protein
MPIKINHSTETIKPDTGVISIDASGALKLPVGQTVERPVGAEGYIRFDSDVKTPEFYDGTNWQFLVNKSYVDSQLTAEGGALTDVINNLQLNDLTDVTIINPTVGEFLTYNTTLGQFINQSSVLAPVSRTFYGDGSTMEFDIGITVSSVNNLVVSINGIQQEPFYSYTIVDGTIVTFDEAPEQGDRIQVRILRSSATSERSRPKVTSVSYSTIGIYTAISIVGIDITYGTGVKIDDQMITRIDYPTESMLQLMIETSRMSDIAWSRPRDLTLVDTNGNEFTYKNLINYGQSKPYWTNSTSYIGSFHAGDSINFELAVNNATSFTIAPAYVGESALTWLSVSGNSIVGTAPRNSSPSRYDFIVTASNGSVDITKNYWILVI